MKRKTRELLLFWLYSWLIINSFMFAVGLARIERCNVKDCLEFFLYVFCLWLIPHAFQVEGFSLFILIVFDGCFIWALIVLSLPLFLWWKKRTVVRAWFLAFCGSLLPQYLPFYIIRPVPRGVAGLIIMTAGYFLAWLLIHTYKGMQAEKARRACENPNGKNGELPPFLQAAPSDKNPA